MDVNYTVSQRPKKVKEKPKTAHNKAIFHISERVSGIEPPSLAWEANIITTIRYPQKLLATLGRHPETHILPTHEPPLSIKTRQSAKEDNGHWDRHPLQHHQDIFEETEIFWTLRQKNGRNNSGQNHPHHRQVHEPSTDLRQVTGQDGRIKAITA